MTTLAQVRDGLETRLDTIDGLRVYNLVPDDAVYPAAIIRLRQIDNYGESLEYVGNLRVSFAVTVLTPATLARQQLDLYPFIEATGTQSIPALINTDHTLGLAGVDARVVEVTELAQMQMATTTLFGLTVIVLVFVT